MSVSTLETLPNEILMTMLRYCGDVYTIFQAFAGLNQRFNSILVDKRLHLLMDFLYIDNGDPSIDDYYRSHLFPGTCKELLSLTAPDDDKKFGHCLQALAEFHITRKYAESEVQIKEEMERLISLRSLLSDQNISDLDTELTSVFASLRTCAKPMKSIKRIESLVRVRGACLQYPDSEDVECNFATVVIRLLLEPIHTTQPVRQRFLDTVVRMFKLLIISNVNLLKDRVNSDAGSFPISYFLFCTIYRLSPYVSQQPVEAINVQYYQAAMDLLLYILKCRKYVDVPEIHSFTSFLDLLEMIPSIRLNLTEQATIYTAQIEILKILFDENVLQQMVGYEADDFANFERAMRYLIKIERLDIFLFLHRYNTYVEGFCRQFWNNGKLIDCLTANKTNKRIFHTLLNDEAFSVWLATCTNALFVLLRKKQCKHVRELVNSLPLLVHQADEDDNNPLLYLCYKVRGCRHNLVEYFIDMGCDVQSRNAQNETFLDGLKLKRNRDLLQSLIERGTVEVDDDSGEMKVIPTTDFEQ